MNPIDESNNVDVKESIPAPAPAPAPALEDSKQIPESIPPSSPMATATRGGAPNITPDNSRIGPDIVDDGGGPGAEIEDLVS